MAKILTLGIFGAFLCGAQGQETAAEDLPTRLLKRIQAYHEEGDSREAHQLRVVYFYPSDLEPQANYQARLGRIMADVQDFFLSELKRQGFGDQQLPIEEEEGKLKIHLVKGKEPASGYDYDSGGKVLAELKVALDGVINFDREFVLVMGGMCQKQQDGKYIIHSPYYGWGGSGQRFGLCFAADCELMDTNHFRTTGRKIRYWEHLGDFEKPLASFNHLYIGGLAHELGHGLGLPHNAESPAERKSRGTALMGIGNFTYRQETIGKPGSFLTFASSVRLLSHPLLTQSNHARFAPVRARITELNFAQEEKGLLIKGTVAAEPECYAVIAYTDPAARDDYDARTWVAEVDEEGRFVLPISEFRAGGGQLRLSFCHLNGASSTPYRTPYEISDDLMPDAAEFSGAWVFHQAELAYMSGRKDEAAKWIEAELKANPETSFAPRLAHILQLIYGQGVLKLANIKADVAFLSDVEWEAASVGWGKPARNQYYSGEGIMDSVCLVLGGQFHSKGLYAHAPSRYVFDLDGQWEEFSAIVGLQEDVHPIGSSVFVVMGDGQELYRSELLSGDDTEEVAVSVAGVKKLELVVGSGKEGNGNCWSVWGSPLVTRALAPVEETAGDAEPAAEPQ